MWMEELAVMVDFAREVRVIFLRRLQDHLTSISEPVLGKVDLAERSFPYELAECVVANGLEVLGVELLEELGVGVGKLLTVSKLRLAWSAMRLKTCLVSLRLQFSLRPGHTGRCVALTRACSSAVRYQFELEARLMVLRVDLAMYVLMGVGVAEWRCEIWYDHENDAGGCIASSTALSE